MCCAFWLILNSGLRITEALGVRVRDIRLADGIARSVRVIGKGNRERLVPLAQGLRPVFGFWLSDRGKDDFVLAKGPGGKAPGPHAVRGYLRRLLERAVRPCALRLAECLHPASASSSLN